TARDEVPVEVLLSQPEFRQVEAGPNALRARLERVEVGEEVAALPVALHELRHPVLLGLRADRHRHAVDGTGGEDAPRLEGGRGRIDPLPQAAEVGAPALVDRVLVLQVTSVQLLDEGQIVAGKGGETELHFTLTPRRTNRPGR